MRITYVLPGFARHPVGGFKIVYEYANGLAERGHKVQVLHLGKPWWRLDRRSVWTRHAARVRVALGQRVEIPWFDMDERVELALVRSLDEANLAGADAVLATSWRTAAPVAVSAARPGKKWYFIQHFEDWDGPRTEVEATWRLPLRHIVISRWLEQLSLSLRPGGPVAYIPNGLDLRGFGIEVIPAVRASASVAMLSHSSDWKGTADGVEALSRLRDRRSDAQAILFGVESRPSDLPDWITYERLPSPGRLVEIYNSAAVFLHPSWAEGWPLPPAEAMACGCALVAAGNPGVLDYASAGSTAFVAPIRDPRALSERLIEATEDDEARLAVSRAGTEAISRYTWPRALDSLERVLAGAD